MTSTLDISNLQKLVFMSMWSGHIIGWEPNLGVMPVAESLLLCKRRAPTTTGVAELQVADFRKSPFSCMETFIKLCWNMVLH